MSENGEPFYMNRDIVAYIAGRICHDGQPQRFICRVQDKGCAVRRALFRRDILHGDILSPYMPGKTGEGKELYVLYFRRRSGTGGISSLPALPARTGSWRLHDERLIGIGPKNGETDGRILRQRAELGRVFRETRIYRQTHAPDIHGGIPCLANTVCADMPSAAG